MRVFKHRATLYLEILTFLAISRREYLFSIFKNRTSARVLSDICRTNTIVTTKY